MTVRKLILVETKRQSNGVVFNGFQEILGF